VEATPFAPPRRRGGEKNVPAAAARNKHARACLLSGSRGSNEVLEGRAGAGNRCKNKEIKGDLSIRTVGR